MAWRQRTVDLLKDIFRFAISGALLWNGIMIALASCYVTGKLLWFSVDFLNHFLFAHPWGDRGTP
jgi:hypothetical protein